MGVSHRGSFASSPEGRELLREAAKVAGPRAANVEHRSVYANFNTRTPKKLFGVGSVSHSLPRVCSLTHTHTK